VLKLANFHCFRGIAKYILLITITGLCLNDFELCRELMYKIVDFSLARRNELLAQKKINENQYIEIRKKIEEPLRRQAKDLTLKIYEGIIKSVTGHQTKIATVTTKLKKVISNIDNFNQ
jgi:hypothetical protein